MKKLTKKWRIIVFLTVCGIFLGMQLCENNAAVVRAEEGEELSEEELEDMQKTAQSELMDAFDFGEIDREMKQIFPGKRYTFGDIVAAFLDENETISPELIWDYISDSLFYVLKTNRPVLLYLLFIAMLAAVFTNFSSVFKNQQVAEIGFYILYMMMIAVCLKAFHLTVSQITENLEELNVFMKVLCPTFFLSMSIAAGSVSSAFFYHIILLLIYLVELVILRFLIPMVHVCMMLKILNFISKEEYLSKFASLVELIVSWSLKTLLACVAGISMIQGILGPSIDSVRRSAITKGVEMIPGIGDALGGTTEMILGTAVLIKNGIGVAGAAICILICLWPILEMGVLTLLYKCIAAIIQPVSDKRISEAVSSVADGYQMLLRIELTTAVLFLITIAAASASTS